LKIFAEDCNHLTHSVRCEFRSIIQQVRDGFWIVFTQQLHSKLNNANSTYLIDLKISQ